MNLLQRFVSGVGACFVPLTLIVIIVGSIISTVVGSIPVLGGTLVVTLTIPFITGADPAIILPFLIALDSVSCTGGSVTAILLNVPGDVVNAATMIDGYPMTRKGEGGRAIGAALGSSLMGGALAVPLALLMIPLLIKFILLFKSPEMFMLVMVGLCCISVLTTKGHAVEGIISALLGILFSTIGAQASTGVSRFTFGYVYLYNGIPVPIATLAFFAIPALIGMLEIRENLSMSITKDDRLQMIRGIKDVWKHRWLVIRSMVIGYAIGVLPGIGAGASTFMCYGIAKKQSKHPEEFGHGAVEGVIAPEAANNAKEAGALLTTLALGIPGSATMAIIMSALVVLGIAPGPSMLTKQTSLCITMLTAVALANIVAVLLVWLLGPTLTKITRIKPVYLFAVVLPLVFIGTYSKNLYPVHLLIVFLMGIVGYCFKKFRYASPAFLLGFILGGNVEDYFWKCMKLYGWKFVVSSPISVALLLCCILIVFSQPLKRCARALRQKSAAVR